MAMTVSHEIFVPRSIIFDLFVQSEHLREWYPAAARTSATFSIDAVEGGAFSYAWDDGTAHAVSGVFTALAPRQALSAQIKDDDTCGPHQLEVNLVDIPGGTRIEIRADAFDSAEAAEHCRAGWVARLASLESYLSSI